MKRWWTTRRLRWRCARRHHPLGLRRSLVDAVTYTTFTEERCTCGQTWRRRHHPQGIVETMGNPGWPR